MLIDEFLPAYDVVECHRTEVRAPVERVYDAVRRLELGGSGPVRLLFRLRELPTLLRPSERGVRRRLGLTLDALLESGFVLLGEEPNQELVLGLVGRFWTPRAIFSGWTPTDSGISRGRDTPRPPGTSLWAGGTAARPCWLRRRGLRA